MVTKHIVLNYDLGLRGDYNGLYVFLDEHHALDCGNCTAAFAKEFSEDDFDVIYSELKTELTNLLAIDSGDRIYMIVTDSSNIMKGKFIFGSRKRATWDGYANLDTDVTDQF